MKNPLILPLSLLYLQPRSSRWRSSPRSSSCWRRARSVRWSWRSVRMHGQCILRFGRSYGRHCVASTRMAATYSMATIGTWWTRYASQVDGLSVTDKFDKKFNNSSLSLPISRSLAPQNCQTSPSCCRHLWTRDTACHTTWRERVAPWLTESLACSATGVRTSRTAPRCTRSRPFCCTLCPVSGRAEEGEREAVKRLLLQGKENLSELI